MFKGLAGIVLSFVLGIAMVGFGSYRAYTGTVTCDGRVMQATEVCRETRDGSVTSTYEQKRDSQTRMGYAAIAVGIALVAYGGWSLGTNLRRRKQQHLQQHPDR